MRAVELLAQAAGLTEDHYKFWCKKNETADGRNPEHDQVLSVVYIGQFDDIDEHPSLYFRRLSGGLTRACAMPHPILQTLLAHGVHIEYVDVTRDGDNRRVLHPTKES